MKKPSQNEVIGKYIHDLRVKNKMTLKELGDKVELSPGFLSQLERGYTTFSLNTLTALAEVFKEDLSSFFLKSSDNDQEPYVARSYNRKNLRLSKEFEQYTLFSSIHSQKVITELCNIYPQRQDCEEVIFCHAQEEIIFLLNGCLKVFLSGTGYILNPHDSIYIPPNAEHSWKNMTDSTVTVLSLVINA